MTSLTACIIAYNEEKRIEDCLKSLRGVTDDIVLVHDGPCRDRTLEIARSYGARVFVGEPSGYMEPHLPQAYREAQGEWILRIDADERLSDELKAALPRLLEDDKVDAYEFLWRLHDGQRYRSRRWPYKRCLFRKRSLSFLALRDFVAEVDGEVGREQFELYHRPGFDNFSYAAFVSRWIPAARLKARIFLSDFASIPRFNYTAADWPLSIRLRRRWPLLVLPVDAGYIFFATWLPALCEGSTSFRAALCQAGMRAVIDWTMFKKTKRLL